MISQLHGTSLVWPSYKAVTSIWMYSMTFAEVIKIISRSFPTTTALHLTKVLIYQACTCINIHGDKSPIRKGYEFSDLMCMDFSSACVVCMLCVIWAMKVTIAKWNWTLSFGSSLCLLSKYWSLCTCTSVYGKSCGPIHDKLILCCTYNSICAITGLNNLLQSSYCMQPNYI